MNRIIGFLFLLACLFSQQAFTQCGPVINSFPYYERFETSTGGWSIGGINADWQWGTPNKPIINSAGGGSKSWIVGGLVNSFYSNGQNSWLQSPCFNFSTLLNPQLAFKIFWETEQRFDGASFQYSIDNGNTWTTLGTNNSNACTAENWFNTAAITYLGGARGWSGSIKPTSGSCLGGSGKGEWVTAKHDLSILAGQANVMFRFTFGAGTTCNAFDGFAIDEISISETPPGTAGFTFSCGNNNLMYFTDASSLCAQSYSWNFGDVASAQNTSTDQNPFHIFSGEGMYDVSLTVNFPSQPPSTITRSVTVLNATVSSTNIDCFGESTGAASVSVTGGNGTYSYTWNTNPAKTTASVDQLSAGNYTVNVSAANACTRVLTATITQPQKINIALQNQPEKCGNSQGSLTSTVSGGSAPYNYLWSDGSNATSITGLQAGSYGLQVTDSKGCRNDTTGIIVLNELNNISLLLGNDTLICPGETLVLNAGSFDNYRWQDNSAAPTFTVTTTGNYSVTVTDVDGCIASDAISVTVDCSDIYFPTGFTPNNDLLNDEFGPGGNIAAVKNYSLRVFNRWGDVIFQSNNPSKKWNGSTKSIGVATGTFIWLADYEINGKKRSQKGSVVLIR